jgi:hypothetical protein
MAQTNSNPALATPGSAENLCKQNTAEDINPSIKVKFHEPAQASIAAVFSDGRCIGHVVGRGKTGVEAFDTDDLSGGVFPTEEAAVAWLWRSRWAHPADAVKRVINAAASGTNTITEEAGSKEVTMTDLLVAVARPVQWLSHARELLARCAQEIKHLREANRDLEAQLAAMQKPRRQARKHGGDTEMAS